MKNISGVVLSVPFRIHSFVTDFGKMYEDKTKHNFGGGFGFLVSTDNFLTVKKSEKSKINVPYKNVINKYIDIFKSIYSYSGEFDIELENEFPKHNGYGSTIVIITTVCVGINLILGNKLSKTELNALIFENYCEEDINGTVVEALTSGIGSLTMLYGGIIYMDNGTSFIRTEFDEKHRVVLFRTFEKKNEDKIYDVYDEFELTEEYIESDLKDKEEKMDIIDNLLLPAIFRKDFEMMGKANDILNEIGSGYVDCKQFEYKKQKKLFSNLREKGASLVGISSAGPTAYAIVKEEYEREIVNFLIREGIDKNTISVHKTDNRGIYVSDFLMYL